MEQLPELPFTSRVLGPVATQNLKDGRITQTIRSRKSAYPFFSKRGTHVNITLDGEFLYQARITEILEKSLRALNQWDAEIGGFTTLSELERGLKRAGFRFKPLYEYQAFGIQFLNQDGGL